MNSLSEIVEVVTGWYDAEDLYGSFKTYQAKGLRDPEVDVLRIDYELPGNPFWLRRITDGDVVEVKPTTTARRTRSDK